MGNDEPAGVPGAPNSDVQRSAPPLARGLAMPFLHIVIVRGSSPWPLGLLLWLLPGAAALIFAGLAGENRRLDAFAADLVLAGAGGLALNAALIPTGTDPLAYFFGVRVFWTVLGAFLALILAHDAVRLLPARLRAHAPIGTRGGAAFLYTWISGWPSEPGLFALRYGDGLEVKLTPGELHYQVRHGPLIGARAIALREGVAARADGDALLVRPSAAASELRLDRVRPAEQLPALVAAIREQAAHPPEPISAKPFEPL